MAKIVEVTNPVTGQPTQVDQLDHTAQQIDDGLNIARGVSNPNLLDNWYFGNPVNQRGQTEYTANGYTIDRWTLSSNADSKSVSVESGGIGLSGSSGTYTNFTQKVETLPAGVYTLSFLVDDFSKVSQIFNAALGVSIKSFSSNLCSFTFTFSSDASIVSLGIQKTVDSEKLLIYAAKLELGSQQTLAHQDADGNWVLNEIPDYGEQLRRCQRYFVNFNPNKVNWFAMPPAVASNASQAYSAVTLPVAMRAQPGVSYGGNIVLSQDADHAVTSILVSGSTFTGNSIQLRYDVSAGTLTANSLYRVQGSNDPTSYIWLSADL